MTTFTLWLNCFWLSPGFMGKGSLFSEVKTMLSPCCQNSGIEFYLKCKYFELHLRLVCLSLEIVFWNHYLLEIPFTFPASHWPDLRWMKYMDIYPSIIMARSSLEHARYVWRGTSQCHTVWNKADTLCLKQFSTEESVMCLYL